MTVSERRPQTLDKLILSNISPGRNRQIEIETFERKKPQLPLPLANSIAGSGSLKTLSSRYQDGQQPLLFA